jgi:hypothetical protein
MVILSDKECLLLKIKMRNQDPLKDLDAGLEEFLKAEISLREQLQEINRLGKKYSVRFMKPLIEQRGKREVVAGIAYERLPEFFEADELSEKYGSVDKGINELEKKGYKFLSREE